MTLISKHLAALILIVLLSGTSTAVAQQPPDYYDLRVSAQELLVIEQALGEMPMRISRSIYDKLREQVIEQQKAVKKLPELGEKK